MQNEASKGMNRRSFLGKLLAGAGLIAASAGGYFIFRKSPRKVEDIPGRIVGASAQTGHRLRAPIAFAPIRTERTGTIIVGAGAAGLSSAWALQHAGSTDFLLFELEAQAGGNSSHGQNAISAYPWGAHYIPIPDPANHELLELFEELGIVKGYTLGRPWYEESFLCHAPHERLLIHGSWQEGLVPRLGVSSEEQAQIAAFHAEMALWKVKIGADGRPAFAIPLAMSSQDPEILALDQQPMEAWMRQKGWDAPHLHWYVNYCCRDDFGTTHAETSAWAGIHYFAARAGSAANATESDVLTWPEGNGWIIQRLAEKAGDRVRCGHLVVALRNTAAGVEADVIRLSDNAHIRVEARSAIFAGPRFVAQRTVEGLPAVEGFSYAPWVVANVSLSNRPQGRGAPLSWDNVAYASHSLGYILADHQALRGHSKPGTVLTWYEPLTHLAPAEARKEALAADHAHWRQYVLDDLETMHAGIAEQVQQVDVWIWGHGMIRPVPGFITGTARKAATQAHGRIAFAHSDLSGISIFEEAFYWGMRAAEAARSFAG